MSLPRDKVLHLAAGAATALAGLLIDGPQAGAALCCVIALGRELYGWLDDRFSWGDLLATLIGGAAALGLHAWLP